MAQLNKKMKITIYEARQEEIALPAYFRRPGALNWVAMINEAGHALHVTNESLNEYTVLDSKGIDNEFVRITASEFYESMAANVAAITEKNARLCKKYGLECLNLQGGAYAD